MQRITAYVVCLALGMSPLGARAFDNSRSSSAGSNDSSDNSNQSSDNSNQSSDNSNASSADSNESSNNSSNDQSTQDSSQESSDNSSENSSEASSGAQTRTFWIVVTAVLLLGAVSLVVFFAVRSTVKSEEEEAQASLQRFMREYHAGLVRDITVGDGPILSSLTAQLELTTEERARILAGLASSPEQLELLHSLNGPIDPEDARRFAVAFYRIGSETLGPERWERVVRDHLGQTLLATP